MEKYDALDWRYGYNCFGDCNSSSFGYWRYAVIFSGGSRSNSDKLHPRITDTAKRLWFIYVAYTIVETLLLYLAGMSLFDAVNHSMSTMASGGFSTKNNSLAHWNHLPWVHYIIIIFMFLAGTNFVLSYFAFTGKIQKIFQDNEFLTFAKFIFVFSIIVLVFFDYSGRFRL